MIVKVLSKNQFYHYRVQIGENEFQTEKWDWISVKEWVLSGYAVFFGLEGRNRITWRSPDTLILNEVKGLYQYELRDEAYEQILKVKK